jgi:hypothetical protein
MQALFAAHFPALYEKLAPIAARSFVDRDKEQPGPSNLERGVRAGEVRSGEHPAARRTSVYTAAALYPKTTAAIGVVAVTAAVLAGRRRG